MSSVTEPDRPRHVSGAAPAQPSADAVPQAKNADKAAKKAARRAIKEQAKAEKKAARAIKKSTTTSTSKPGKPGKAAKTAKKSAKKPRWSDLKQFGLVLRCTHPALALGLGVALFVLALLSGRPAGEAVVAGGAVFVLNLITGLVNDAFDRSLDAKSGALRKPIAEGRVTAGNAAFVATALFLVLLPMAFQNGTAAGFLILGALLVALLHDRTLHRTPFSVLGWMISGVLYVYFLAYGGWGLGHHGSAPAPGMVLVGALAGLCLHLATSLTHLPLDHAAGIKPFPLVIALRTGAPKLLLLTAALSAGTVMAFIIGALGPGLHG